MDKNLQKLLVNMQTPEQKIIKFMNNVYYNKKAIIMIYFFI